MNQQRIVHILCFVITNVAYLNGMDANLWTGAQNLLQNFDGIEANLQEIRAQFVAQATALRALVDNFDKADQLRNTVTASIKAVLERLQQEIATANADRLAVLAQSQLDQRTIAVQVEQVRQDATTQINALTAEIAALTGQIEQLQTTLATLSNMDVAAVQKAMTELVETKQAYQEMVVDRQMLLSSLTTLLDRWNAYNYDAATATATAQQALANIVVQ